MAQSGMKSVESLLEQGLNALDAGDFPGALVKWNKVLEVDPGNVRAARLVEELRQLIRDGESANHVPATGDFLVVVDDDAAELQSADKQARFIARGALERLRNVSEAANQRAEELDQQLAAAGDESLALKSAVAAKDKELIDANEHALDLERRLKSLDNERRDLERFKRQREHQGAELELRLAEAKAVEKKLNEDVRRLTGERDSTVGQLEEVQQALDAASESLKAESSALAKTRTQLEKEKERAAAAENALAEAQATAEEAAAEHKALVESAAAEQKKLTETIATQDVELKIAREALAAAEAHAAEIESARASLADANDVLQHSVSALEQTIAELEKDANDRAAEVERIATDLVTVAAEADAKITAAQDALADSQAARNAMRTEMATVVNDLDAQKVASEELQRQIDAIAEERAEFETTKRELEAQLATREATFQETHEVAESALGELEAARDEIVAQETLVADLRAQLEDAQNEMKAAGQAERLLAEKDAAIAALEQEVAARELRLADVSRGDSENLSKAKKELAAERAAAKKFANERTSFESRLATRDAELESLNQTVAELRDQNGQVDALQRELDSHRVKLSAAEGRLRESEAETAELQAMVDALQAEPIEMAVSDSFPVARSTTTPHGNMVVSGAFRSAQSGSQPVTFRATESGDQPSAVRPPPIPVSASGSRPAASSGNRPAVTPSESADTSGVFPRNNTPTESSASARLADESLTAAERLSWLVDESPYVANTDVAPDLSAQAAFVLQNIDGNVSFADLIDIVGLPSDETAGILVDLLCRGIVTSPALEP